MAVTFHEVWKPAAYNEDLRERMGVSYATNAFYVVRTAVRREMLLALTRLWDKPLLSTNAPRRAGKYRAGSPMNRPQTKRTPMRR
jgi:hypothetical protein